MRIQPDEPVHLRHLETLFARIYRLAEPILGEGLAEFLIFGFREAAACVFAGCFFLLLALSSHIQVPGLFRYDLLFLGGIGIQLLLLAFRLETWREVAVLSLFHLIGVGLELFKTQPGIASWSYPEAAFFKIGTVPLYSGFMYAAVASYLIQAWRLLRVEMEHFPPALPAVALSVAIYANFFTHHWIWDLRWVLTGAILILFRKTWVRFTVVSAPRRMPLALSFLLIGFFIWVAENIATFFGAWAYPNQAKAWTLVGPGKISSWTLLIVISFIIVAVLKRSLSAPSLRAKRSNPGLATG